MTMLSGAGTRASAACLFLVLLSPLAMSTAAAQGGDRPGATPGGPGPMTVERVKSGFLVAPDFKVTGFDHRVSELAGAYAGWLTDQTFFVGGGGYWLANRSRDREMAYGGLMVGWLAHGDRRISFGAKGLVGGGRATLLGSLGDVFAFDDEDGRTLPRMEVPGSRGVIPAPLVNTTVRIRQEFFIAEPEANVVVSLRRNVRLSGGVGYRLIGGARDMQGRLRGATGSLALQIGGGS
jgi:hypothetical protein